MLFCDSVYVELFSKFLWCYAFSLGWLLVIVCTSSWLPVFLLCRQLPPVSSPDPSKGEDLKASVLGPAQSGLQGPRRLVKSKHFCTRNAPKLLSPSPTSPLHSRMTRQLTASASTCTSPRDLRSTCLTLNVMQLCSLPSLISVLSTGSKVPWALSSPPCADP